MNMQIIIPAYNEEHRIAPTLEKYASFFESRAELVVVLNGCTDDTLTVVEQIQKKYSSIKIINVPEPIGKGAAIIRGWRASSADVVGFVDADGATIPEEFQKLVDALDEHDGAIASRFLKKARVIQRQSFIRTFMSRGFIVVTKILFHLPYRDTQCGAKLFRRKMLAPVLPTLRQTSMLFDVELLLTLHNIDADIVEIPTIWVDQPGSASLGSHTQFFREGFRMLRGLFRLKAQHYSK